MRWFEFKHGLFGATNKHQQGTRWWRKRWGIRLSGEGRTKVGLISDPLKEGRTGDWEGAWEVRGIAPIHPWPGCWWSILSGILYKALEWVYPITNFLARGSSWLVLRAQNKFGSGLHFHFGQVGVLTPDKDFLLLPVNKRLRNMSTSGNREASILASPSDCTFTGVFEIRKFQPEKYKWQWRRGAGHTYLGAQQRAKRGLSTLILDLLAFWVTLFLSLFLTWRCYNLHHSIQKISDHTLITFT